MSLSKIRHIVLVRIPNCPRNPAIVATFITDK